MAPHTRPEPMNASPHHSKVKITISQADNSIFVAGTHVTGKMEMECRTDQGLGIGVMMVELFATQELTSRDHSATSTFLHSRRLFQGPGLPPSNAVQAHPLPGDLPLPAHHHQARRGISTFLFRIPLPTSSPPSISFGADLATIKYELRASVSVYWKGEKRLVTCRKDVQVVESCEDNIGREEPEGVVVVGEHGKIWVQGKVVGGMVVAGESACVELQVKNHCSKKNTALTVTLTRTLFLPTRKAKSSENSPAPILEVSDTLTTVSFKGPEYIIAPGGEGVASLVFDVPKDARGVRGGLLEGGEGDEDVSRKEGLGGRVTESLFEIRCAVVVKMGMGFGSKDINLEIPVQIVHPAALPEPEQPYPYPYSHPHPYSTPSPPIPAQYSDPTSPQPYIYPPLPLSPLPVAYHDPSTNPTHVWLPPPPMSPLPNPHSHPLPLPHSQPHAYTYYIPPIDQGAGQQYYFPSPPPPQNLHVPMPLYLPARPLSAGASPGAEFSTNLHGYLDPGPNISMGTPPNFLASEARINGGINITTSGGGEPEEGKGERAERVTRHLRMSSRHRSVSPMSHRFPVPAPVVAVSGNNSNVVHLRNLPPPPINPSNTNNNNFHNLSIAVPPTNTLTAPASKVHSPRPVLSPKHSFSVDPVTHNSISKSERVEALERMAAEVGEKMGDLSAGEIPNSSVDAGVDVDADIDVNKTLPPPPLPSGKERVKRIRRMRVDTYFAETEPERAPDALHPMPSDKTPPTPTLTAVTPAKLQIRRSGTMTDTRLLAGLNGTSESGLDALERRLLAEVGTRKLDKDIRPDVRNIPGVQPITIPMSSRSKEAGESLNDSAISSLTLAGAGGLEGDREQEQEQEQEHGEVGTGLEVKEERLFELRNEDFDEKHERDSDEKTHRAARSSVSGDERAEVRRRRKEERRRRRERDGDGDGDAKSKSSSKGEKEKEKQRKNRRKEEKEREKEKDGESLGFRAKKSAAAKGRVTAWLGGIDPDVPPPEDILPPSPSFVRDMECFPAVPVLSPIPGSAAETEHAVQNVARDIVDEAKENINENGDVDLQKQKRTNISSAPNPRSSGFVPIGTLKHDTYLRRPLAIAKDASVAEDARRIADIWSSTRPGVDQNYKDPSPILKDASPILPALSPPVRTPQSIRTNRRVSPPSLSTPIPVLHTSGAITRVPDESRTRLPRKPLEPITRSAAPTPLPPLPPKKGKVAQPTPRLPVFPPPRLDPEVKYDVRSARGGRGGQVAAVASIWASGAASAQQQKIGGVQKKTPDFLVAPKHLHVRSPLLTSNANSNPNPNSNSNSSSGTKLVEQSGKPMTARRPIVKSPSVPAVISSSHATPMLSSTASLARPPTSPGPASSPYKMKHGVKVPTTIVDSSIIRSDGVGAAGANLKTSVKAHIGGAKPPGGDLAFGQARLRDLIKKYQGTAG